MKTTVILLIRHGDIESAETFPDATFLGQIDAPLSGAGFSQAETAAAATQGVRLSAVLTSDLVRAKDTARPIAQLHGLPVQELKGLRERALGVWEGEAPSRVAERQPAALGRLWSDPDFAPPGGESFAALVTRVTSALAAVVRAHAGETIAVVTHGGVHSALVAGLLGLGPGASLMLALDRGHASLFQFFSDGGAVLSGSNLPPSGWRDALDAMGSGPVTPFGHSCKRIPT
ncbi:MAG: histidine phosphatase family protein [Leptospirillia bacterium]